MKKMFILCALAMAMAQNINASTINVNAADSLGVNQALVDQANATIKHQKEIIREAEKDVRDLNNQLKDKKTIIKDAKAEIKKANNVIKAEKAKAKALKKAADAADAFKK